MRTRALLVAALVLAAVLAGCTQRTRAPPNEVVRALADTRAMDWSRGNYWAYRATFEENVKFARAARSRGSSTTAAQATPSSTSR